MSGGGGGLVGYEWKAFTAPPVKRRLIDGTREVGLARVINNVIIIVCSISIIIVSITIGIIIVSIINSIIIVSSISISISIM